jgi:hypothetical protein
MAIIDGPTTATDQERYCSACGHLVAGARYCPGCGLAVGATNGPDQPTAEQPQSAPRPPVPDMPPPDGRAGRLADGPAVGSASHSRRGLVAGAGLLSLAVIAVVVVVLVSGGGSNQAAVYRQKLSSALAPVVAANGALSSSLQSLHGADTTAAVSAVTRAQNAVVSARGAMAVLTVPAGSGQLSQQVQQALTEDGGYLQAVTATISRPSAANIAQLQPLVTSVQSALVPLASIAPAATTSLSGTDALNAWASGRVAAAARASAAEARVAQRHEVQKAASTAAQQAVNNNDNTAASSSPATTPSDAVGDLPVQCGSGVSGSAGVSCPFAENAFYEYWSASDGDPVLPGTISVWSAEGQATYTLTCSAGDGIVDCSGTNVNGVPLDTQFTQSAVSAYTSSEAAAYAASGKLGP